MATCPRCKAEVEVGASGCSSCGVDFAQYTQYLVREQKKKVDALLTTCRECGQKYASGLALCPKCQSGNMERYYRKSRGEERADRSRTRGSAHQAGDRVTLRESGSRLWLVIAALLGLVVTLALVFNFCLAGNEDDAAANAVKGSSPLVVHTDP
jgi:hypothetical protein